MIRISYILVFVLAAAFVAAGDEGFILSPTNTKVKLNEAFTMSCTLSAGLSDGKLEMIKSDSAALEWMEVRGGQYKNLHLETQELQVKTDSALNSQETLTVLFYADAGNFFQSFIVIWFAETYKFSMGWCTVAATSIAYDEWISFDSEPTSEINKIWRITEKSDHSELYIYCNDELVLTYVYTDSPHQTGCVDRTASDVSGFKFYFKEENTLTDTASDFYRVVVKTAPLTGNEQTLEYSKASAELVDAGYYLCSAKDGEAVSEGGELVVLEPCTAGNYMTASGSCQQCEENTYSGDDADSCTSCPDDTISAAGSKLESDCQYAPCSAGDYMTDSGCQQCEENTYSGAEASECTSCPDGKISAAGSTTEDNCQYAPCSAGDYMTDGGCQQCKDNTYSGAEASECTSCPDGKISAAGSTTEDDCQYDKKQDYSGALLNSLSGIITACLLTLLI